MQLVVCSFGRGTGGALCHAQRHPTKDFRRPRRHGTHTHASRPKGMTHTREAKGAEGGGKAGGGGGTQPLPRRVGVCRICVDWDGLGELHPPPGGHTQTQTHHLKIHSARVNLSHHRRRPSRAWPLGLAGTWTRRRTPTRDWHRSQGAVVPLAPPGPWWGHWNLHLRRHPRQHHHHHQHHLQSSWLLPPARPAAAAHAPGDAPRPTSTCALDRLRSPGPSSAQSHAASPQSHSRPSLPQ